MKRNAKGIWTLNDDEMHKIRKVFEFVDIQNALTLGEIEIKLKMDEIYFDNFKTEMFFSLCFSPLASIVCAMITQRACFLFVKRGLGVFPV